MSDSIGLAFNFYREPNALPGMLENAMRFFDDILAISAPPKGAPPDDETIDIVKKFGIRLIHTNIDEGFGVVRSMCLHSCPTEWVLIGDADERFFNTLPVFAVSGSGRYPEDLVPDLHVGILQAAFAQGERLRNIVKHECKEADAVRMCRRHWMDWGMHRPCQNWYEHNDWQLRFLRNRPYIGFKPEPKMHEHCVDFRTGKAPIYATGNTQSGPFIDHFHCPAKAMEPEQRREDIAIYDALHKGVTEDMWVKLAYREEDAKVAE